MNPLRLIQFWLFLTFCSYLSLTSAPPGVMLTVSDKLLHAVGYLLLYLSCSLAYPFPAYRARKLILLLAYSVIIEMIQHFIPHRGFSLLDILANGFGLLCGLALFSVLQPDQPQKN